MINGFVVGSNRITGWFGLDLSVWFVALTSGIWMPFLGIDVFMCLQYLQETACQIVKFVGDSNVLHRIASEGLAFVKKAKLSLKQGQVVKCNAGKENGLDHKQNISGECFFLVGKY